MKMHRRDFFQRTALGGVFAGVVHERSQTPPTGDLVTFREPRPGGFGRQGGPSTAQTCSWTQERQRHGNRNHHRPDWQPARCAIALASRLMATNPSPSKSPQASTCSRTWRDQDRYIPEGSSEYSIEAAVMPDDADLQPEKMPVHQSVSLDNSVTQFTLALGAWSRDITSASKD